MTLITATAPGKIILFGEHAVVYGQPALAVPVTDVFARVTLKPQPAGSGLRFEARDLDDSFAASRRPTSPLSTMARVTVEYLKQAEPDAAAIIESTIPVAGGLGSGAAVSAALGRALAHWFGHEIDDASLSGLVYEIEKLHHGTPSGIDNTVICHARPVFFTRGSEPELLSVKKALQLIIADTGVASATRIMVSGVRERWSTQPDHFNALFEAIGGIVRAARNAIECGDNDQLGPLMADNQRLLVDMGVSSPEIDRLVDAARRAGAAGAKLSGGGGGGNIIALADPENANRVVKSLTEAGAVRTIISTVQTTRPSQCSFS